MKRKSKIEIKLFVWFFSALIIWSCAPMDLDNLEPFKYVIKDFDNLPEIGKVELVAPKTVQIETGGITIPGPSKALVTDVLSKDLDEATIQTLTSFSTFRNFINPNTRVNNSTIDTRLKSITVQDIDNILNPEIPLDPIFASLHDLVKFSEVSSFLPIYTSPRIISDVSGFSLEVTEENSSHAAHRTSSLVTPCLEAVQAEYQKKLAEIEEGKSLILRDGEVFYKNNNTNIEQIKSSQLKFLSDTLQKSKTEFRALAINLNGSSNQQFEAGNLSVDSYYGIKVFLVAFLVESRINLVTYEKDLKAFIEKAFSMNINNLNTAEKNFQNLVNQEVNIVLLELNKIRITAANNCHNQGGGN